MVYLLIAGNSMNGGYAVTGVFATLELAQAELAQAIEDSGDAGKLTTRPLFGRALPDHWSCGKNSDFLAIDPRKVVSS